MKYYILLLAFILCMGSCQQSGSSKEETTSISVEEEEEVLYKQVIKVHDEVMPKLQTITQIKSEIEQKITELEANDPSSARIGMLRVQMVNLDNADEAMMGWMRNFKANHEGWEHDSIMRYLENEKLVIEEVGKVIDETIVKSREMLE